MVLFGVGISWCAAWEEEVGGGRTSKQRGCRDLPSSIVLVVVVGGPECMSACHIFLWGSWRALAGIL